MNLKPVNESPTQKVVLGIIGVAILGAAWHFLPWWGLAIAVILLTYEAWTLVNEYEGDTISEILWGLSGRPIVPWLFGLATGWAIEAGYLDNPWVALSLGFLQGHFWFQAYRNGNGRKVTAGAVSIDPRLSKALGIVEEALTTQLDKESAELDMLTKGMKKDSPSDPVPTP